MTAPLPRIIHTAQALVDEVAEVATLPARGQNVMAESLTRYAASAVNVLTAAARSGATCVHAGAHGTGPNGDLIREALTAEGVTLSAQASEGLDTGTCFVMVEPSGERTFVTSRGAERRISVESLATSRPVAGDFVCVSGYSLLPPTVDPLLTWLESLPQDVLIVLDPGAVFAELPRDVRDRTLRLTDVWTSNAEEAQAITHIDGVSEAACGVAELLDADAVVIVRDGREGCVVREHGETVDLPGYPQEPVDTNGAGDCHTGVTLACRAAGLSWQEAARRANAAGAIKVTRKGPASSPTGAEIEEFLDGTA